MDAEICARKEADFSEEAGGAVWDRLSQVRIGTAARFWNRCTFLNSCTFLLCDCGIKYV
jgi:hypothetical protein